MCNKFEQKTLILYVNISIDVGKGDVLYVITSSLYIILYDLL